MTSEHKGSILIVDDEPTIAEVVGRYLERAGYSIRAASDGREALELARDEPPDLVVLDLMLPGVGGLELLRRLRERERVPVVILTAKDHPSERVTGLQLGADDYVVKPFSPAELVARIDAVLRRARPALGREEPIVLNGLTIDADARRAVADGDEVPLTAREFDLLLFLARHPGRAFSRDELMEAVWDFSFYTDTSTVTVHVRRLREKIEADPSRPRLLQTVWGHGYRLQP